MLQLLKQEAQRAYTENGAITYATSGSACLDLFASIGALRGASDRELILRFGWAFAEDSDLAMKILFFARDVRGGLGERRVFRVILRDLASDEPESVRCNLGYIAEFGRYDDLLCLLDTPCEGDVLDLVRTQLARDWQAYTAGQPVSLLAKWLPSINASSAATRQTGKRLARAFHMTEAQYRRMLHALRSALDIVEDHLRLRDYSFAYSQVPSQAMLKYRQAFIRNDSARYQAYLEQVLAGEAKMKAGTLYPYELVRPCLQNGQMQPAERAALAAAWQSLPEYGAQVANALVVVDGSGSMYGGAEPWPITVALSLGLYFAQRARGAFRNHFITFSARPRLVELKGRDLYEQVRYSATFSEAANTDLQAVFDLILRTAVRHALPQSQLPETLYIISDMEFDACVNNGGLTNFERARQRFVQAGYQLPQVVFWNVASRNVQQPVRQNEQGVALVSGASPRVFNLVMQGAISPYQYMLDILSDLRYAPISAY